MRVLVTGGAGFVGSNLAVKLKAAERSTAVVAFDNLHRRGSELTLSRLRQHGVEFVHGDIRLRDDVERVGPFDVMVECSAEPSVHAGYDGSASYVINTNLVGTINCLEAARRAGAALIFLSTSRVYPIEALRALPLVRSGDRLELEPNAEGVGWTAAGVTRNFPLAGHRSIYGATKLASELLIEEFRHMYGLRAIVNRCGVIAGPWQMGKVDQGFVVLWAARHLWGDALEYRGFGGDGLQVRDLLHVDDLFDLLRLQLEHLIQWDGSIFNVGGGRASSVSLRELTAMCADRADREIPITSSAETAPADIPYYISNNHDVSNTTGWRPRRDVQVLVDDVFEWLRGHEPVVRPVLTQV